MRRFEGKVALVTGAARGQGRQHAKRLAEEGASIIAIDICDEVKSAKPTSTPDDLATTVSEVEALDARILARAVDIRDEDGLIAVVNDGVAEFGGLDTVAASAGIAADDVIPAEDVTLADWKEMVDINLTGAWLTCKAAIPHLKAGASITITGSALGVKGMPNVASYTAAKHGAVGLMRALAHELGPKMIRVNIINPGQVGTPMILNEGTYGLFCPDIENPTQDDFAVASARTFLMPIPWLEPDDISNALLFLASEEGRYITGVVLPVDAGMVAK